MADLSHDGLVPYVAGMHACVQTQYDAIHVSAQAQLVIVLIVRIGCEKIPGISHLYAGIIEIHYANKKPISWLITSLFKLSPDPEPEGLKR